jgi:hypothetical protein
LTCEEETIVDIAKETVFDGECWAVKIRPEFHSMLVFVRDRYDMTDSECVESLISAEYNMLSKKEAYSDSEE